MSNEYTLHTNFERASDDPRAEAEYEYRMRRAREREDELEALVEARVAQSAADTRPAPCTSSTVARA